MSYLDDKLDQLQSTILGFPVGGGKPFVHKNDDKVLKLQNTEPSVLANPAQTLNFEDAKISFDPPTDIFYIKASPKPEMPVINLIIDGVSSNIQKELAYICKWSIIFEPLVDASPKGRGEPQVKDGEVKGNGNKIRVTFDEFRGGKIKFEIILSYRELTKNLQISGTINGRNPPLQELRDFISKNLADVNLQLIVRQIIHLESTGLQFESSKSGELKTIPVYSKDLKGGVGIKQLTNPPPKILEFWNWQVNVKTGISLFLDKIKNVNTFVEKKNKSQEFSSLVKKYNKDKRPGLPELKIVMPEFTDEQIKRASIRAYNGKDEFDIQKENGNIVVVDIKEGPEFTGKGVWVIKKGNNNYVNEVLKLSPI